MGFHNLCIFCNCQNDYQADTRNLNRGWGLCCSKSCAASKREKSKPGYDPATVALNNKRREGRETEEKRKDRLLKEKAIKRNNKIDKILSDV